MPLFRLESPALFRISPKPLPTQIWVEAQDEGKLRVLEHLPQRGIAVVGTRYPHLRSVRFVNQLTESLKDSGLIILSGLAQGIDSAAHEAALLFGLPTIAILGCGLEHTYPDSSKPLRKAIVENGGLILSEFSPETEPRPFRFVQRNRLIAAGAQATCVIQAGAKSGAIITADYALQLHRTVLSMPSFPNEFGFEGNQRLLDEHCVHSLWGAHSLGICWLGLAAIGKNFPAASQKRTLTLNLSE